MKRFLVIGRNSFISKSIIGDNHTIVDRISIRDPNSIESINFAKYDAVLNCAIHSNYIRQDYDSDYDLDYQIANRVKDFDCHYVMLSSRKVYGENEKLISIDENHSKSPVDNYARNKLFTELYLQDVFGHNKSHTIVRCSNVFGFEYLRNSFMGFCTKQLKESGYIHFDISSKIKRDFIPVDYVGQVLKLIMEKKLNGIFNLSSNYALEIGKIAECLIEGYGSGTFSSNDDLIKDQFVIDCSKLEKSLGINIGPFDYKKIINDIGQKLCKI